MTLLCHLSTPRDGGGVQGYRVKEWCWDEVEKYIYIKTLEGYMLACDGDWVIKGIKGEFYPCQPDIFEMTYEHLPSHGENEK